VAENNYMETYKKRKKNNKKKKKPNPKPKPKKKVKYDKYGDPILTGYEKRMKARKEGKTDTKEMYEDEKTGRALKRFDPSLEGTDRGGYPKQFYQQGRKKSLESPRYKKYIKQLRKYGS
jgi:hypothetical protein